MTGFKTPWNCGGPLRIIWAGENVVRRNTAKNIAAIFCEKFIYAPLQDPRDLQSNLKIPPLPIFHFRQVKTCANVCSTDSAIKLYSLFIWSKRRFSGRRFPWKCERNGLNRLSVGSALILDTVRGNSLFCLLCE